MKNGYIAIFGSKQIEIYAPSMWAATEQARKALNVPKSKYGLLSVILCEIGGEQITHSTASL